MSALPADDATIRGERPTSRHRLAAGHILGYQPRAAHTRAIAEGTRRILAGLRIKPTLRALFYLLVSAGLVEKSERGYELVKEQVGRMRKGGYIEMDAVIDGTRNRVTWRSFDRPSAALEAAVWSYARDPWTGQPQVAELWCEADTHRELLRPVAMDFHVPLVVTRGNSSLTQLYDCAQAIGARWALGQRTRIIYVGDFDPPGLDMSAHLADRLAEMHMPPAACTVQRVALIYDQIKERRLPERPAKKNDTRTPWFEKTYDCGCVELDALPPDDLVAIVRAALAGVRDVTMWTVSKRQEAAERRRLRAFIDAHREEVDA